MRGTWVLLAVSGQLLAAEPADDLFDKSLDELMTIPVQTASRTAESRWQAPGTIYSLTRADIEARGYRHLGEVLRDLPGVDSHQLSSGVFYNRFSLRGISGNNKFIIVQDGLRIGAPAGEPLPLADNFPLHHVQRVEVVMGPASALYGADAVTGVVQLFSDTGDAQLAAEYGENRLGRIALRAGSPGKDGWHFALHAMRNEHDDLRKSYPEAFPWTALTTFGGDVIQTAASRHDYWGYTESRNALAQYGGEDWRLGLMHQHFQHPSTSGDLSTVVDYGAFWGYDLNQFFAEKSWADTGNGAFDVRAQYRAYAMDNQSSFRNIFTDYRHGYEYAESQQARIESNWQRQWGSHRLVAGVEVSHTEAIPKTADLIAPFDDGRSVHDQGFYFGASNDIKTLLFPVAYDEYAIFMQDSINLGAEWALGLGARYGNNSEYGDTVDPRVNLNWQFADSQRLNLLYGEAYLAPSPQFTYEHYGSIVFGDSQNGYYSPFMQLPNPDLKPEQSRTLELNYAAVFSWGEVQATAWQSELDDLILPQFDPTPNTSFLPNTFIDDTQINANVGQLSAHGVDLWTRSRLGRRVEVWAAYSYADGNVDVVGFDQDSPLPYVAQQKLKAGLSWRISDAWLISPILVTSSNAYPLRSLSAESAPGYAIVNLFSSVKLAARLELELRIQNLFDTKWYSVGDATSPTFVSSPQETRSASLGLSWRF